MVEHFVQSFQEEVFDDFALQFQLDLQTVLLHLVPVVRAEGEFPFEHVDDLVLILLVDALQVLLVVNDVLFIDYATPHAEYLTQTR